MAPKAHRGQVDVSAPANGPARCDARDPRVDGPHGGGEPELGLCENPGALRHIDHRVARSTIAKVLKEHGIKPSPDRPKSWTTFVRSHAHLIAAADFFTTEAWTVRGLVRHFTLFFLDIAKRRVHIAGTTTNPTSAWMEQIARNLTDCEEDFLTGRRF